MSDRTPVETPSVPPVHAVAPQREPLVALFLAVIAGTLFDELAGPPVALLLGAAWCALGWWYMASRGARPVAPLALLVAVGLSAAAYHGYRTAALPLIDRPFDERSSAAGRLPMVIEGRIVTVPCRVGGTHVGSESPRGEATSFCVEVRRYRRGGKWQGVRGRVLARVAGHVPSSWLGCRVRIYGSIEWPEGSRNPGGFSMRRWCRGEGIACRIAVSSTDHVRLLPSRISLADRVRRWLVRGRAWCAEAISRHVDGANQGLAAALLWGDRRQIDGATWERYQETGTAHLLAVSGLHLALVVAGLWYAQWYWFRHRRVIHAAIIGFAVLYAMLTGGRPPAWRAAIVLMLACAAQSMLRYTSTRQLLAAAGLAAWLRAPSSWSSPGVQLSFTAVSILAWWRETAPPQRPRDPLDELVQQSVPRFFHMARHIGRCAVGAVAMSAVVSGLTGPLIWYHFGVIAPAGMVLCPILALPLSLALTSGLFCLIGVAAGWPVALPAALLNLSLAALRMAIDVADRWTPPLAAPAPAPLLLLLFYAVIGLAWVRYGPRLRRRWVGAAWSLLVLAILLANGHVSWPWGSDGRATNCFECTVLSVGHGQAVLLALPDGRHVLCDAGTMGDPDRRAGEIARALARLGCHRLDIVIVSHADRDHYNMVLPLARRIPMTTVVLGPRVWRRDGMLRRTLQRLVDRGVSLRIAARGDAIRLGRVRLDVLHPDVAWRPERDNADSLVMRVTCGGRSIVLPGDVEGRALDVLPWEAVRGTDVLIAPHHGSRHSVPRRWVERADPRVVVISGGRAGAAAVLSRWRRLGRGRTVLHTAVDHAVRIRFDASGMRVARWSDGGWSPVLVGE